MIAFRAIKLYERKIFLKYTFNVYTYYKLHKIVSDDKFKSQ